MRELNTSEHGGKSEKFLRREKWKHGLIPQNGENDGDAEKGPPKTWRHIQYRVRILPFPKNESRAPDRQRREQQNEQCVVVQRAEQMTV